MISLNELLSSISRSVQNAQLAIQDAELHSFLRYFEQEGESNDAPGHTTPISPKVQPFCINEENSSLNVPLVTLAGHRPLSLDTVRIVMNVNAKADSSGIQVEVGPGEESGNQQLCHQITLEFKRSDAAEGVSRILDTANQFI